MRMDASGNIPELDSYWINATATSSPGTFTARLIRRGDYFTTYTISVTGEILTDPAQRVTGVIEGLTLTASSSSSLGQNGTQLVITGLDVPVVQAARVPLGLFLLEDDTITGSSQDDIIRGLTGNDVLTGRRGQDALFGGEGNDTLIGGSKDADRLYGGNGDDVFSVADASHVVIEVTGGGQDTVVASVSYGLTTSAEVEVLRTNNDASTKRIDLTGSTTANMIIGNAGANILSGRGGDDTIIAGAGNDTVLGGAGADQLSGGQGVDQLSYAQSATAVIVDLGMQEGFAGDALGDLVIEFEHVQGSSHSDSITGDSGANRLIGGRGNDLLVGGGGNDTLIGSQGNDSLVGGAGVDRLDYSQDTGLRGVTVNLTLGTARDGFGRQDAIADFEDVRGTRFGDVIVGSLFDETLRGEEGSDRLTGNAGNDRLLGGAGRDRLTGGDGNDTLWGGAGHDTLTGGLGQDIFVFNSAPQSRTNIDRITDFTAADDVFYLENAVLKNIGYVKRPLRDDFFHLGKSAEDALNRIIYDKASGSLYYDPDGTGSATQIKIAVLTNKVSLDHTSFYVI
jgi:Ca2+-binding RTX toxin-like protein